MEGSYGLGAARMALAVLKAAVSFGIVCRKRGCANSRRCSTSWNSSLPSRKFAPTADQITARAGRARCRPPARAFGYAIQFETTRRQWDVIGEWLPLHDPRPSALLDHGKKWIGPTWAAIDEHMILRRSRRPRPRTRRTSPCRSTSPSARWSATSWRSIPLEQRKGPLIVNPNTGLPYIRQTWRNAWTEDFKVAGLPKGMWNRDLRAGGITEGGKAGASRDDRRKLAGHTKEQTTEIYDRERGEAHRRVMQTRKQFREKNEQ